MSIVLKQRIEELAERVSVLERRMNILNTPAVKGEPVPEPVTKSKAKAKAKKEAK